MSSATSVADGVAQRPGAAILALTVAGVAQAVDVGLNNTAIASAAADFGLSASQRAFAASAGTLAMAALILTVGSIGDRRGRRLTLLWCCLALIVGGIITAVSTGFVTYVVGRVFTGVGLAGTLALSIALIRTVAPDQVPRAMSLYFTGQVAFALPLTVLGGWLINISWRLGYLVVPAVGAVAFVLNKYFVPRSKAVHRRRADPVGLVLVAVALVGIISGVSDASEGWSSPSVIIRLTVGVVAMVSFLIWESRHEEPALPVQLFADRNLSGALTADMSFNMFQAVMTLQLSLLWQYLYGYAPLEVTLGQLPATVAMIAGAFAAGRWAARGQPPQRLIVAGLAGVAVASGILTLGGGSTPYWVFAIALVLGGFSRMLTETTAGQFFVDVPPPDLVGATAASKPAVGQASFALGLALSSSLLYGRIGHGLPDKLAQLGLTPAQQATVVGWFSDDSVPEWARNNALFEQVTEVARDTYVDAYRLTMSVFTVIFVVLAAIVWLLFHRAPPVSGAAPTDQKDR